MIIHSIAQKIKCDFLKVFQIANTLKVNRFAGYCKKQNHLLFSCCSKGNAYLLLHHYELLRIQQDRFGEKGNKIDPRR